MINKRVLTWRRTSVKFIGLQFLPLDPRNCRLLDDEISSNVRRWRKKNFLVWSRTPFNFSKAFFHSDVKAIQFQLALNELGQANWLGRIIFHFRQRCFNLKWMKCDGTCRYILKLIQQGPNLHRETEKLIRAADKMKRKSFVDFFNRIKYLSFIWWCH